MADVNLSVGSSNVDKSYSGVHTNQVIHFIVLIILLVQLL